MAHPLDQPSIGQIPSKVVTPLVSFDIAYKQLMSWEDSHPPGKVTTDAGGKTRYGISQRAYPSLDIDSLTEENAKTITEKDYWNYGAWDISKLPLAQQALANKLFQFGFNVGVGTVIQLSRMIQHVIFKNQVLPKLAGSLTVFGLNDNDYINMLSSLAAAQLSRYVVDYHGLSRVPNGLLERALCIE